MDTDSEYSDLDEDALLRKQFAELKDSGQLPSPSGVGIRILCLTQREDFALDELAAAIKADPALTGRILRVANSAHNRGSERTSTVKDAAMRLGTRVVSNIALGFTLLSGNRMGQCQRFDYERYWSWSLACAVSAQEVSARLGSGVPAQMFTAGLLARIGSLALASVHATDYAELLCQLESKQELDTLELETERFGINHQETALIMLGEWGLPESFCVAVSRFEEEGIFERDISTAASSTVRVLRNAAALADFCVEHDSPRPEQLDRLDELRVELDCSDEELLSLCVDVREAWRTWGAELGISTHEVNKVVGAAERAEDPEPAAAGQAPQQESGQARKKLSVPGGLRILAVDDDSLSLRVLKKRLEMAGHQVTTAVNGREALELALKTGPQIVLTDWMMPEMDGIEFTKALRRYSSGRGIYVIILTSREEEDRVIEAFDAGVDDYVTKPFKPKLLLARVRAGQRVVRLQEQVARDRRTQREQVARLAVLTRKLRAAAMTDVLTDLPNRRYAMKRLEEEWAHSARAGTPLSIVMIDIDHFKRVNDQHGHDVGDLVLRETARVLRETTRDGDVSARIGGEEFLVLCRNTNPAGSQRCAERIRQSIEANLVEGLGFSGSVTVSAGVATRSMSCLDPDDLIKRADRAVYAAKQAGRNRVCCQEPEEEQRKSA